MFWVHGISMGGARRGRSRSVGWNPSFVRVRRSPRVSWKSWRARSKAVCMMNAYVYSGDQGVFKHGRYSVSHGGCKFEADEREVYKRARVWATKDDMVSCCCLCATTAGFITSLVWLNDAKPNTRWAEIGNGFNQLRGEKTSWCHDPSSSNGCLYEWMEGTDNIRSYSRYTIRPDPMLRHTARPHIIPSDGTSPWSIFMSPPNL